MKRAIALSLLLVPLAGCSLFPTTEPADDAGQHSSVAETKNVIYRGMLRPLGSSIYMEGTHRLELEDGRFVLLEADGILLDEYLDEDVEVFGATRPTVEGGGIIMRVERIAEFVESSAPASSEAFSSEAASAAPSSAPAVPSSAPVAASRASIAPVVRSSAAPAPASSAPAAVSSAPTDAVTLRAQTMAKANMDAANWTQRYCTSHIGFCVPVHKNWYYVSFGATSSSLWHVEMSSEEIVALGDGPISVVLRSGAAPAADGQVTVEGGVATGVRAWTNNRHFVISAPAVLETAVRYVTQELVSAPTSSSGAAQ
jgi:hypothetical protein